MCWTLSGMGGSAGYWSNGDRVYLIGRKSATSPKWRQCHMGGEAFKLSLFLIWGLQGLAFMVSLFGRR